MKTRSSARKRTVLSLFFLSLILSWGAFASNDACALTTGNLLIDEGFDIPNPLESYSVVSATSNKGVWAVDELAASAGIVTAENGVAPIEGTMMLRMEADTFPGSTHSQARQLVDVSSFAGSIANGNVTTTLVACFNVPTVAAGAEASVMLEFFDGAGNSLGGSASKNTDPIGQDGDTSTWEHVLLDGISVPLGTVTVGAQLLYLDSSIGSNPVYADKTDLRLSQIVPEPSTAFLALLAGTMLRFRSRKQR